MIDPNSRYAGVAETKLTAADGREIAYLRRRFLPQGRSQTLLVALRVREGDRLDVLAARTLGQADQWWRIADANDAMQPAELTATPGRLLRVPVPEG